MSKALYLDDPDGHGIEIAWETPERFGRFSNDQPRAAPARQGPAGHPA